ncbi:hypothetical protein OIU34_20565 [Pararhizobium sp. BT-229]|uniref:hypothetical protein n=1 Tax=Pararhizobium sp. BT-229 TaxID=2986923 RepID=UPI0021F7D00C|nr:hypothetical protein [Pararhizobium sp. BT-229]MCV9964283.1 hypothetical protein [Pararhizobium sp. BT-229]
MATYKITVDGEDKEIAEKIATSLMDSYFGYRRFEAELSDDRRSVTIEFDYETEKSKL